MATAAVLREVGGPLRLEPVELTDLRPGEVRVRMAGVGVCHTDLVAQRGLVPLPLPAVLGHEGAGTIEAVGPGVDTHAPGDPVVLSFDSCGACPTCTTRTPAYCEAFRALNYAGTRRDGTTTLRGVHGSWLGQSSFATHAIASVRNAVAVPAGLPLERLGPLGCSLLTGAGAVLNVLRPSPGEDVAVFGAGAVGLAAVMAARAAGCAEVVAIDPNPERRALAAALGASRTCDPAEVGRLRVHHSVDAVGTGPVIAAALRVLRSPGHCATVGFRGPRNEVTIDQGHLLMGRRLSGVIEGDADPQVLIPELIELHRTGAFPFERLVRTYAFEEINDALAAAERGDVVKAVVVFDT